MDKFDYRSYPSFYILLWFSFPDMKVDIFLKIPIYMIQSLWQSFSDFLS